jgi:hypothetical protein
MGSMNALKGIGLLEKQLQAVRKEILQEENGLMGLEKQLFAIENQWEHELLWQFSHLKGLEKKTEKESQRIKKQFARQLVKLSISKRSEQVSRTIMQQKLLEQKLEKLRQELNEEMQKMGKA